MTFKEELAGAPGLPDYSYKLIVAMTGRLNETMEKIEWIKWTNIWGINSHLITMSRSETVVLTLGNGTKSEIAHDHYNRYSSEWNADIKARRIATSHVRTNSLEILDLAIDRECEPKILCSIYAENGNGFNVPKIPLYHYHDIPEFLQGNPYVTSGYRSLLPFSLCCKRYMCIFMIFNVFS